MKNLHTSMPQSMQALPHKQTGLTLVELMISLTLGLLVVMAAVGLLVSSKSGYVQQDDASRLQDTARFIMETIGRTARQGAYENWETPDGQTAAIVTTSNMTANIIGFDNDSVKPSGNDISSLMGTSVNGSDVLAVRFYGAGVPGTPDGTVVNCMGLAQDPPVNASSAETERAWSIFYVSNDSSGEPELRCKYRGQNGTWKSDPIARGVESFQVLYGLDTDPQYLPAPAPPKTLNPEWRVPNVFMNASAINALDASIPAAKLNRDTNWKRVASLKIGLLLRGSEASRYDNLDKEYHLFGEGYTNKVTGAKPDPGTYIKEVNLPLDIRNRTRKVFTTTIWFRNQIEGGGAQN